MKRFALVLVALFVIAAVTAHADDSTFIRVTQIDGLWNTDTLRAGDTAKFYVMVGNRSSNYFNFSNGFKVYSRASKDAGAIGSGTAQWPSVFTTGVPFRVNFAITRPRTGPLLDTLGFLKKSNFGAVLSHNCFSCDGQGSDTVGISGAANDPETQTAIAPFDSGVAWRFSIVTRKEDHGKAICFDSTTNYPPTNTWKWASFVPSGVTSFPDWSGPHCFWLHDPSAQTNLAPVLAPIGSQNVNEGQPLVVIANATDPDATIPAISASPLPTGASFVDNGNGSAQLSWTPGFNQAGVYPVTFIATDGSLSDTEIVQITVNNVNRAPVLDPVGPKAIAEGANLLFGISGTDPDGGLLTYGASPLPAGATFNSSTGEFNWTPGFTQAGAYDVSFFVTDGTLADSELVTITVSNTNRAPVLVAIGAKNATVGELLTFNTSATDPDGTTPIMSATALANATFVDNGNGTGTFNFTPVAGQIGTVSVTFAASDGSLSDDEIVEISVSGTANQAPILTPIGSKSVAEAANLNFVVAATDPDFNSLTFSASPLPAGATFNPGTQTFDWTPGYTQAGDYNVLFVVSDGTLADSEVVAITVTNTNRPPVLAAIGARNVQVGSTLAFNVSASDPDATVPTLSATALANATFTDNANGTGSFSFTPNISQVGTVDVTFTASDGSLSDDEIVTITVTPPPCAVIQLSKLVYYDTVFVGESASAGDTIAITSSGETLNWSITPAAGFTFGASNGTTPGEIAFSFSELFTAPGATQRCFTVTGATPNPEDTCISTAQVCVNIVVNERPCVSILTSDSLLSFTAVQGDTVAAPFARFFTVSSSDGARNFAFSVKAPIGNDWVRFDTTGATGQFDGTTPAQVPVQVRPGSLGVGAHYVDIVVSTLNEEVCQPRFKVLTIMVNVTRRASADTVLVENKPAVPGQTVSVPVNFVNSCPLKALFVNVDFDAANLYLSGVSFAGSRIEYVSNKSATIDQVGGRVFISADVSAQPLIPSDYGNLATLIFVVRPEAPIGFYPLTNVVCTVPEICNTEFFRDCGGGIESGFPEFVSGGIVVDQLENSICGYVVDTNGVEIPGATVQLWGNFPSGSPEMTTTTSSIGSFFFEGVTSVPFDLYAFAAGYYPKLEADLNFNAKGIKIVLTPLGTLTPTSEWVDYYCDENFYLQNPLPVGSVVEARTPGDLLVGRFVVTTAGKYGFMPVYRANEEFGDDGANTDDNIRFFINGLQALATGNTSYPAEYAQVQVCLDYGATVTKECVLTTGWNLVSWNVQTPTTNILDVLGPYMNCIEVILGFEQGGLTYDPLLADFSTLWDVDHYSGYWIKVKPECEVILTLEGLPVPMNTPIPVTTGWNLVSYLPIWNFNPDYALQAIYDKLLFAYGWNDGIEIFKPGSEFNTLTSMGTCNGYWVKINADDTLIYPDADLMAGWVAPRTIATVQSLSSGDYKTPTWVNLYATNLKLDGVSVGAGSEIEAFSVTTNAKVGSFTMKTDGKFGFMPVYADADGQSLKPGGQFYLTVDGTKANETFTWTANGDRAMVSALTSSNSSGTLPDGYSLEQNYPNPFNPTTTIGFSIPANTRARIEIYNVLGALIAVPFDDAVMAGEHQVVWDGRDQNGQTVASGVYLYKLVTDSYSEARKMMLLK